MYKYTTKIEIPNDRVLFIQQKEFEVIGYNNIRYKFIGNKNLISESKIISIECGRFNKIEKTIQDARVLYKKFLWYAFINNFPLRFLVSQNGRDEDDSMQYFEIFDDNKTRVSVSASVSIAHSQEPELLNKLILDDDNNFYNNESFFNAIDIYNLAKLSNSKINKLILLVICLESCVPHASANSPYSSNIDDIVKYVTKLDDIKFRDELVSRLNELKRSLIRKTISTLIQSNLNSNKYLGYNSYTFFDLIYKLRSEYTHSGSLLIEKFFKGASLNAVVTNLESLVKDLLFSIKNQI